MILQSSFAHLFLDRFELCMIRIRVPVFIPNLGSSRKKCCNSRLPIARGLVGTFIFQGVECEAATMTIVNKLMFHARVGKGDRSSPDPSASKTVAWATSPHVLACSAAIAPHRFSLDDRPLCSDRRGPFDHLQYMRFGKSTIRIVVIQGSQIMSQYLNDELSLDMKRDERVSKGKMTQEAADRERREWTEREWRKRWEGFNHRVLVAFVKYHSVIMVMRFYEHIASKFVDDRALDQLTLDTFESAKRRSSKQQEGMVLAREMFETCWRANLIGFLADYSIHQVILVFGYYVYVRGRQQQLKEQGSTDESKDIHSGSLAISLIKKSTLLAISRGIALGFASVGGAMGSVFLPGWGTLAGTNLADSLASSMMDDMLSPPKLA